MKTFGPSDWSAPSDGLPNGAAVQPSVTVVVPTYNNADTLEVCLRSVRDQTVPPDELIVVDPGSSDATRRIARELATLIESPVANRCYQQNLAASVATSDFLCFIDADMKLSPKVVEQAKRQCAGPQKPKVVVLPEVSFGPTFWARAKAFERSFYNGIWWMEFPRWISRALFRQIGGFDTTTLNDDWVLDQEIRAHTHRYGRIDAVVYHDEGPLTLRDIARKETHFIESLSDFRNRYPDRARLTMSVAHRIAVFLRQPHRLFLHPVMAASLPVMAVAEIGAGRGWYRLEDPWPEEKLLAPRRPSDATSGVDGGRSDD